MDVVNAISKVRFGTAKPQRVQLHKSDELVVELLCLEAGQKVAGAGGRWAYYVVTGTAALTANGGSTQLPTGQLATVEPGEEHTLTNATEARLVVLATGHSG
jgi:quercetin dioxygenase-like cupin family protein